MEMMNENDANKVDQTLIGDINSLNKYIKMKEYNTQLSLYFTEKINEDKLKFLYTFFDDFYEHFGKFKDPKTKQTLTDKRTIQTMIQKRMTNKTNEIRYLSKSKVGRLNSSSWCLQNMNKICRHFLTDGNCIDLDIVNAHPNFLLWFCDMLNIPAKYLEDYIVNRDGCFQEYMDFHKCNRENAKEAYLSLINDDGKLIRHDDPIYNFYNEMKIIQSKVWEFCMKEHPEIITKSKDSFKLKKCNLKGICIANFLQTIENKVLQVMIEFVQKQGFNFVAPCHDGGLLPKDKVDKYGLEKLIEDLEFHIFDKLNIKIKLISKPMELGKELDEIYLVKKNEMEIKESRDDIPTIRFEKKEVLDDYCFKDFWTETRDTFDSLNDLLYYIKEYLPKVLIYIHHNKGIFLKNEGANESCVEKFNAVSVNPLKDLNFYYKDIIKKKTEVCSIPLWKLIELSKVRTYSSIVCRPNISKVGKNEFNVWIPFLADKKIKYDMTRVQPILTYIENIICNNIKHVYKWFFSWLRIICKYPHIKTGIVPLLFSKKQRAGKGTFVNWLISCVFGYHCSYQTNITRVTKNFNSFLQGKVFVYIDELPTSNGEYHNIFDNLKNLITDPFLDIEKKGVESYMTDNLLNFIASTNNKYSVKIEKDDGRWCVIPVNEEKVGDRAFFDHHYQNVFTAENAIHFFNYMIDIDDDDELLVNVRNIPQTDLRQEIQNMCLSPPESFLEKVKNRELDIEISIIGNIKRDGFGHIKDPLISELELGAEYKVRVKELYRVYDLWCDETNTKRGQRKYLTDLLEQHEGKFNINNESVKHRYYII